MNLKTLCWTAGSIFICMASQAWAQDNGLKTVDTKGTLEDSSGFQLKIKDKAGKEWNIFVDPSSSTLRYTGTADVKLLSPGMLVRFSGRFDSKGNAQADLKELEVFRPRVGVRMMQNEVLSQTPGIYPTDDKSKPANANANVAENKATGNTANTSSKNNSNAKTGNANVKNNKSTKGSSKRTNDAKSGAATPVGEVQEFRVVGQIVGVQGNKLQVATGSQSLVVQLAENAKVKVSMPDAEYGVKGDDVHVVGLSNSAQPDAVQAKIVTITGSKPLAGAQLDNSRKPNDKNVGKSDPKKTGKADSKASGKSANKNP